MHAIPPANQDDVQFQPAWVLVDFGYANAVNFRPASHDPQLHCAVHAGNQHIDIGIPPAAALRCLRYMLAAQRPNRAHINLRHQAKSELSR